MSAGIKVGEQYQIPVILPDGHTHILGAQDLFKAPNKAKKLNTKNDVLRIFFTSAD